MLAKIVDIRDMPDWKPSKGDHGDRGIASVSEGKIYWDPDQKAMCRKHGAINCVSTDRRIWRCIHSFPSCGEGCYVAAFPEEIDHDNPSQDGAEKRVRAGAKAALLS